jgi:hypothetical protein
VTTLLGVQLRSRIASTYDDILEQARRNAREFVWSTIRAVEELGRVRMAAMNDFLADYTDGKSRGRYVDAALPNLLFRRAAFDLMRIRRSSTHARSSARTEK